MGLASAGDPALAKGPGGSQVAGQRQAPLGVQVPSKQSELDWQSVIVSQLWASHCSQLQAVTSEGVRVEQV